jgi:CubicO group peptidase (beta-lactamase class C family)
MERTIARLEDDVASGAFTRGSQVTVLHGGRVVLAYAAGDDGAGRPLTTATMFRVYCAIKPVVAVAVARLVESGDVELDEPLETRLPSVTGVRGGVTARHVLTHTAGLHHPSPPQIEVVAPSRRRSLLETMPRPDGWRVGVDAAFSEYTGWYVLGWLLEVLTGTPLRQCLRAMVLDPLGLNDTWIGMTDDEYNAIVARLGVAHDLRGPKPMPMLLETARRWCTETNPAHGGYSTATDLARFYDHIVAALTGRAQHSALPDAQLLGTFCSAARPRVYDQALDRACTFGLGFMTDLRDHLFGETCSSTMFGHSGYLGTSYAVADPRYDLAIAVIHNGIVAPQFTANRRAALLQTIYADLALPTSPPSKATAEHPIETSY